MTHSRSLPTSEVPSPIDDPNLIATYASFRQALTKLTLPELMELSARQAALLELEQRQAMTNLLSNGLSDSIQSLDRLSPSSRRTARQPSPADRGAAASPTSAPRPLPGAVDLLAGSKRLAPRVAAKLVLAEARRAADRG